MASPVPEAGTSQLSLKFQILAVDAAVARDRFFGGKSIIFPCSWLQPAIKIASFQSVIGIRAVYFRYTDHA
jgi:hypothetical protein